MIRREIGSSLLLSAIRREEAGCSRSIGDGPGRGNGTQGMGRRGDPTEGELLWDRYGKP